MTTQTVHPDNGSREGKWVALMIIVILAFAATLLPHHQVSTNETQLEPYQVHMSDLNQEQIAFIADIKLAHEEIRDLYLESGVWPEIKQLEALWIAPFVKDQSWKRKGSHQWQRLKDGVYLGIKHDEQGASSVILDSHNAEADIWFSDLDDGLSISDVSDLTQRQGNGWRQIVTTQSTSHSHAH